MDYQNIRVEIEDEIAIITFNRPESLNALSAACLKEFRDALLNLEATDGVKVVIVTGAGKKAFVAGADIKEISEKNSSTAEVYGALGHECLFIMENMSKVVIAAVNGFALGGGTEIALGCDFIFASENARFGQPEVILGVMPGFGGTQRLPKAVGIRRARELIYTAEQVDAKRAMEIGMVNRVFPLDTLLEETKKIAKKICANSFNAVKASKKAINTGFEMDLFRGCEFEKKAFALTFDHEDFKEGTTAFIEKRKTKFKK